MLRSTVALALLIATGLVTAVGPAAAAPVAERQFTLKGAPAPGPARLDRVFVRAYGPQGADTVLILTPGSPGGQGNFAALAPALVDRVAGLQVWSLDRRANALEDVFGFTGTPDEALGYYLLGQPLSGRTFAPVSAEQAPYIRRWGAKVAIDDLHRVVRAARKGGKRKVILGGHSAGAVTVPTYAAWDFGGRGGFEDLAGLVQIDGGQFGAFAKYSRNTPYADQWRTAAEARAGVAKADKVSPFGIAGAPLPVPLWTIGVLPELACAYATATPQAASTLQSAIPEALRPLAGVPAFPVTDEALFGSLLTGGKIDILDMRAGSLAATGDPRPWVNGPESTVPRICSTFTQEPGNGLEWYYPAMLDHELLQALTRLQPTPATRELGLRPLHLAEIDIPLYVFETGLTDGGVLASSRRFLRHTQVPRHVFASDQDMGHFDPLEDVPEHNRFIQTVVPFLRSIADPG
jgi:hypothetical protein